MFTKQHFRTSYVYKTKQNSRITDKLCLQNKQMFKKFKTSYVYKTKLKFTNTSCFQNKSNVCKRNVYKTKVYKYVMFTKQNTKQKVYKTKQKFTNTLCLQNKIQNRKFTKQNKTKVYKHVIFIKQKLYTQVMFTKQNNNIGLQTSYVYKTQFTNT